jgi:predicted  nucleic acid-binding Zn-ribbon protein
MPKDSLDYSPDFRAGYQLMEALMGTGVLTEARFSIIKNSEIILEALRTPDVYEYKGIQIPWKVFNVVYTDFDKYPSPKDILEALGMLALIESSDDKTYRQTVDRVARHFRDSNPDASDLAAVGHRMKSYSEKYRKAKTGRHGDDWFEEPTRADIDPGRRGRSNGSTRIIDKINSQELLTGEFYSDFSRIPPSRWGNWLRFWDQEKTSVQQDKRLFGRSWKKTFVLGYQLEANLVYEVWYNSIDSSFAVYDSRGNQMTRRFPTLSEAMKALTNAIVQSSSQDRDVLAGGMNNQIANSLLRSMAGSLDQHIIDLQRLDDKEQVETIRKREDAERAEAQQKAKRESKKAEAARFRQETVAKIKTQLKSDVSNATSRIFRDTGRVGVVAIDTAFSKLKSGAIAFDKFAKTVIDSLELTQEEKDNLASYENGDMDFEEYMDNVRNLVAKRKAEQMRTQNQKARGETPKKAASPKKKEPPVTTSYSQLSKPVKGGGAVATFESYMDNDEAYEAQEDFVDNAVNGADHTTLIRTLRNDASKGNFTQTAIKNAVNSTLISVYGETRVDQNFPRTILPNWVNKGRREPIVLPTDKPGIWNRTKMLVKGIRYQADFIVGFSLSDRVNIEIWYITEPNPEHSLAKFGADDGFSSSPTVSSFYVFDVTAGKLLRKYVPYYRNAVQLAMAKLSAQ